LQFTQGNNSKVEVSAVNMSRCTDALIF